VNSTIDQVLDQLAADADVPVHIGLPLPQGDVMVIPAPNAKAATDPIPDAGVRLVEGRGGHVHLLMGRVAWRASQDRDGQMLGVVTVLAGEVGYVAHGDGTPVSALDREAEHGLVAFGPGTYRIVRQREQREVIALVTD
jgi:hypothetical protein